MPITENMVGSKPPKHAIVNGFAIGHLPSELMIEGEDRLRRKNMKNEDVTGIVSA